MSFTLIVLAQLLLTALAIPALLTCSYLLTLTLLSAALPRPARSRRQLRFAVIVPAHNEAAVITRCLASLQRMDWPKDQLRLWVIADNCDDATAELAQAAGALVLKRRNKRLRSKGYALAYAFDHSVHAGWTDAFVVIDADSEVSPNLIEAFATRIEGGATALQAHFGVLNAKESWRTGLMAIAHGAFHSVRSRARERLLLSCGLRGNGWCLTRQALAEVPYRAFSVTEDIEYGIELGLAGHRVHYVGEAEVNAVMESSESIARQQRQRWENGRFDLLRTQTLPLLRMAIQRRSKVCLDLALDLLVLPLSYVAFQVLTLLVAAALLSQWQAAFQIWLWPGLICSLVLLVYVLRGWQLSGRGLGGLLDLLCAPFFILWKLGTRLQQVSTNGVRTWVPTLRRRP